MALGGELRRERYERQTADAGGPTLIGPGREPDDAAPGPAGLGVLHVLEVHAARWEPRTSDVVDPAVEVVPRTCPSNVASKGPRPHARRMSENGATSHPVPTYAPPPPAAMASDPPIVPVEIVESTAVVDVPRAKAAKAAPKWEADARDRVRTAIRRFSKPLQDLVARDANEGDTRLLVTDFLCDAFGYDKYEELTTEYQVKGEFADYGVRLDKQLVAFIEVKRCTTKLSAKHLRQVTSYAVNEGVEWMWLTNGACWHVYHLTGGLPIQVDLALEIDLLADEPVTSKVDAFFYLTRESFRRRPDGRAVAGQARPRRRPRSSTSSCLSRASKRSARNSGARPDTTSTPRRWRCISGTASSVPNS